MDFLASGETIQAVLENYPGLVEADIYACIAYGAEMSRERFVDIAIAVLSLFYDRNAGKKNVRTIYNRKALDYSKKWNTRIPGRIVLLLTLHISSSRAKTYGDR